MSILPMVLVIPMIVAQTCLSVTAEWASQFEIMLTDPPYSRHVHKSAVSCESKAGQKNDDGSRKAGLTGAKRRELGFGHLTPQLRRHVARVAASVQRWSLIYSDVESSQWIRIACQAAGAQYIRTIPWKRWSMPQMTGTMPPQGFEHLACFYGSKGAKGWNGQGNLISLEHEPDFEICLEHLALRGDDKHKAEKPLDQALDLVSWFSQPGWRVLDLFAGSGVFGLACRLLDRHYIGFEIDPIWIPLATAREIDPLSLRDLERLDRWLSAPDPVEACHTPKSRERWQRRQLDKQRIANNI